MQQWANGWFSPGTPLTPLNATPNEDAQVISFDYQPGLNLQAIPRSGFGLTPFSRLRNFSDLCEEVRVIIEAFKREIRSLEWEITKTDENDDTDYAGEIARIKAFWDYPDRAQEFDSWLNSVLEDMLAIDAVSLFLEMSPGGEITAVQQVDGTTIRPLIDYRGRIPAAPIPAYAQVRRGMQWLWMTSDRLLYKPFNTAIDSIYGASPTEFILTSVETAMRRRLSAAEYWDKTNIPEAVLGLPADWNTEQIATFQEYWDTVLAGDHAKLRRLKMIPSNGANLPIHEFRRPDGSTTADEWMMKLAGWAFGFLPSEFGITGAQGLGGKGFLEGQENTMWRFGVGPVIQYICNLITGIIRRQTKAPLKFAFKGVGPQKDQDAEAAQDDRNLKNGVIDINVLRAKAGQPAIPNAKPFIIVGSQALLLDDLFNPKPPPPALQPFAEVAGPAIAEADPAEPPADTQALKSALVVWRTKAQRRRADGKSIVCDPPAIAAGQLPAHVVDAVKAALTKGDINAAFDADRILKKKPSRWAQRMSATQSRPSYP